jgi:hypothetical protein
MPLVVDVCVGFAFSCFPTKVAMVAVLPPMVHAMVSLSVFDKDESSRGPFRICVVERAEYP